MEIFIAVLIVTWAIKHAVSDVAYAVRGKPSPRARLRAAQMEAAVANGGRVPATGAAGYFAGLWADAWEGAAARRQAKAAAEPQARWAERPPGIRRHLATRWETAWARRDAEYAKKHGTRPRATDDRFDDVDVIEVEERYWPPGVPAVDDLRPPPRRPGRDDSWLERVVDGGYGDQTPGPGRPPAAPETNSGPPPGRSQPPTGFAPGPYLFDDFGDRFTVGDGGEPVPAFVRSEPYPGPLLSQAPEEIAGDVQRIHDLLKDDPNVAMSDDEIAAELDLSPAATSRALDWLVDRGTVARKTVPAPLPSAPGDIAEDAKRIYDLLQAQPEKTFTGAEITSELDLKPSEAYRALQWLIEHHGAKTAPLPGSTAEPDAGPGSNVHPIRPDITVPETAPNTPNTEGTTMTNPIAQSTVKVDSELNGADKAAFWAEAGMRDASAMAADMDNGRASLRAAGVKEEAVALVTPIEEAYHLLEAAYGEFLKVAQAHQQVADVARGTGNTQGDNDYLSN